MQFDLTEQELMQIVKALQATDPTGIWTLALRKKIAEQVTAQQKVKKE